MRSRFVRRLLLIAAALALPIAASAQEATITGTVTDTTGGVLPGVTVTAVHEASGITFEAVTDERGVYRMPARIGSYRVAAVLAGFGNVTRPGVPVAVGQTVTIPLQLSPSGLTESVTVTGEAPLIDVTTSSLGTNISEAQMTELPVNGRNWQDLAMLAVGNRVNDVSTSEIAATGSGTYQVNVDGQQVTYYSEGLGNVQPRYSRDAIAEFEFISNRFDATQGRSQGIQINAVTRGGTNTLSGGISGYFRDARWNAPDNIVNRRLPYSNQQISTTLGGPLIRDKFHFFVNYEAEREPLTTVWTTPYPAFNLEFTAPRQEWKAGLRLDYQFSPSLRASFRGSLWDNHQPYDSRFGGSPTTHPSRSMETRRNSDQELLSITQVFGSRAVNEFKTGYAGVSNTEDPNVRYAAHPSNRPPNGISSGSPIISFNGFNIGPPGSSPQDIRQGNLSLRDDFTISVNKGGRHDLKMGGEYIKNSWWLMICRTCTGTLDAQGGPLPANFASLFPVWDDPTTWNLNALNPIVRRYQLGIGNMRFFVDRHVFGTWLQDDWQVSPNLTLNLGVRYDLGLNAFGEEFDFQPWVSAGRPNDTDNIQPRVGFAYRLSERTVLRGGFGKYYAEVTDMSAHGTASWKDIIAVDILNDGRPDFAANPFNGPIPSYADVVRLSCFDQKVNQGGARPNCVQRTVGNNLASPDAQYPYSWQGSVGFQRQINNTMAFEADYVYSISGFNIAGANINQAYNPETGVPYPFTQVNRRPFPEWGTVSMRIHNPGFDAQEHSIQMGFTKRFSDRWQGSATYLYFMGFNKDYPPLLPRMPGVPESQAGCTHPVTWNATFTQWRCDVPVNFGALGVDIFAQEWYRTGDQTHRVVFNGIYALPYDFQLSGLYFYGDNGRNTTTSGVDVLGVGGNIANRIRADRSVIPRNNFRKTDLHRVDLRFYRRFRMPGNVSVEPTVEVFNLFNRENFTNWQLNESNATFGQPTAANGIAYAPRVIQFGFRARF
jgi:hypothetical protein